MRNWQDRQDQINHSASTTALRATQDRIRSLNRKDTMMFSYSIWVRIDGTWRHWTTTDNTSSAVDCALAFRNGGHLAKIVDNDTGYAEEFIPIT